MRALEWRSRWVMGIASVSGLLLLCGCVGQGPEGLASSEVRDAIRAAATSAGNLAASAPTGETLQHALASGELAIYSLSDIPRSELNPNSIKDGSPAEYLIEAEQLKVHVLATGYAQAQGLGGMSSAYAHACAVLTLEPGKAEVQVSDEDCPEPYNSAVAAGWGETISAR